MSERSFIPAGPIQEALEQTTEKLLENLSSSGRPTTPGVVGIANGGLQMTDYFSQRLQDALGQSIPKGVVNTAFQRDDIGQQPIPKMGNPTELPFDVNNANIFLIDDVLFTGRTVRAAINEIFAQGRPASVKLVILYDRGHRKLPIQPDFIGFRHHVDPRHTVRVNINNENFSENCIEIIPHE